MDIEQQLRAAVLAAADREGSVNKLCKAAGVPQASVSAWLSGAQGNLSMSVAKRLCSYLGIELKIPRGLKPK